MRERPLDGNTPSSKREGDRHYTCVCIARLRQTSRIARNGQGAGHREKIRFELLAESRNSSESDDLRLKFQNRLENKVEISASARTSPPPLRINPLSLPRARFYLTAHNSKITAIKNK